jgi:hypothetical protein
MSNPNDLLLSILAMDAYNRGYDPGLGVSGNTLGDATVGDDSTKILNCPDKGRRPLRRQLFMGPGDGHLLPPHGQFSGCRVLVDLEQSELS